MGLFALGVTARRNKSVIIRSWWSPPLSAAGVYRRGDAAPPALTAALYKGFETMVTTTTLLPTGMSNAAIGSALSTMTGFDPTKNYITFDDFLTYTAAQWVVTETQAGATQAVTDGFGGLIALVNSAANNDLNAIQQATETILLSASKAFWFKARLKVSQATLSSVVVGIQIANTTPLTVTDGIYFIKAAAATSVSLNVEKNDAISTIVAGAMADDTFVTVGFAYDGGGGGILVYFNDNLVGSVPITNLPNDENLAMVVAVANGDGNARTLTCDYMFAAVER